MHIDLLSTEPGLVYLEEVVFYDGTVYKGQCKYDGEGRELKHGYGVLIYPDGAKYQGYFKDNLQDGRGLLVRADGDVYDGNSQNSLKSH